MRKRTKRPATYADLKAVPPHLIGEIIDGKLYTRPRAGPREVTARTALLRILTSVTDGISDKTGTTEPSQSGG